LTSSSEGERLDAHVGVIDQRGSCTVKCPKCRVELETKTGAEQGFEVLDVCPSCNGAWFDKGELDALDDSVLTNVEELAFEPASIGDTRYSCPRCGGDMEPLIPEEDRHLVIDRCPRCEGFWLDPGELDALREISLRLDEDRIEPLGPRSDRSWLEWLAYALAGRGRPRRS
jgi:Zn-finger nucleic acid-binding protein